MSREEEKRIHYLTEILGNKWSIAILWYLSQHEVVSYEELRAFLAYITNTNLKSTLANLISLKVVVLKGEDYALSPLGRDLAVHIQGMFEWSKIAY